MRASRIVMAADTRLSTCSLVKMLLRCALTEARLRLSLLPICPLVRPWAPRNVWQDKLGIEYTFDRELIALPPEAKGS